MFVLTMDDVIRVRSRLLAWYKRNARSLPWREKHDPYSILVSEVMLQQTRVDTVVRYYGPFLERFPTVESLAAAEPDEVLAYWSGLGYYRRARNLLAAARRVVEIGRFPETSNGLRDLPGIGPYTAAAVASIAFGESTAVIDGNVERVLGRVLGLESSAKHSEGRSRIFQLANELLAPHAAGDSNQALMELGATLCTPIRPACSTCPMSGSCVAERVGRPEDFPLRSRVGRGLKVRRVVAVVQRDDRYLLSRIADDSKQLAGLWEFPWVEDGKTLAAKAARLGERYGGQWELGRSLGRARHTITNRSLDLDIRTATMAVAADEVAEGTEVGWFDVEQAGALPSTAMLGKVLRQVRGKEQKIRPSDQ